MSTYSSLRKAVDDEVLADRIWLPHDEARLEYKLASTTVHDTPEFERILGDYYAHHHALCVSHGGRMPEFQAVQAAKRIIENLYRRRNQTLVNAVSDAKDGRNGGMGQMLDAIRDALKNEAQENYIAEVIDRHIQMDSYSEKLGLAKDMLAELGPLLPERVRKRTPEELAGDYRELVRTLIDALREAAAAFRRT